MRYSNSQSNTPATNNDSSGDLAEQLFVIQKHYASRLHYDFRLKMEDPETGEVTLISWAVPKNLPRNVGVKHLAIRVENHDLSYLDFEGEIAEGNYGAGKVEIWDRGKWGLVKGGLTQGRLAFNLWGKKLKGRYQMVLTNGYKKDQDNNVTEKGRYWLIWKKEAGVFF